MGPLKLTWVAAGEGLTVGYLRDLLEAELYYVERAERSSLRIWWEARRHLWTFEDPHARTNLSLTRGGHCHPVDYERMVECSAISLDKVK